MILHHANMVLSFVRFRHFHFVSLMSDGVTVTVTVTVSDSDSERPVIIDSASDLF